MKDNYNKAIWFDMDGTIADLYGVDNWLDDLMNSKTRPYEIAKPMVNLRELNLLFYELKKNGYQIGVISWLAKCNDEEYHKKVKLAKYKWLDETALPFDLVKIVPYGTNKREVALKNCNYDFQILIDDETPNLKKWRLGKTINPRKKDIIKELRKLL